MESKNNNRRGARFWRPVFFVSLFLALVSLAIHIISANNAAFANVMAGYVTRPIRAVLAYLTAIFPFSLAEVLLILSPLWLALLIWRVRRVARDRVRAGRFLSLLLSVPLLVYTVFTFTFSPGYYTTPLAERISLSDTAPDRDSLSALTQYLAAHAAEEAALAGITPSKTGSEMPMSYRDMNLSLLDAYERLTERYDFISNPRVGTKQIALSEPMAYTHITGVYTFFTGEMNVCTAFPDFSTVFTAAHEMAHARGIAREDEANFIAFLACEASDDAYIRYAGYMSLLQYVSNALYDTDPAEYNRVFRTYNVAVLADLRAYNECFRAHSGSVASDIAESINNAYLSGMGTEGSISYSLVVRLAVAYFN